MMDHVCGQDFLGGTERKLDDTLKPLNGNEPGTPYNPIQNLTEPWRTVFFNTTLCN